MFLVANSVLLLVIKGYMFIDHLQTVQNPEMGDFELWKKVLADSLVWFGFFPQKKYLANRIHFNGTHLSRCTSGLL